MKLAGEHLVVVGSGHSAMTAVVDQAAVARAHPGTKITWVLRRGAVGDAFGGGAADQLPQRGALGQRARQAVEDGVVELVTGFRVDRVEQADGGLVLVAEDGRRLSAAARVVVLTGFRPDLSFLSEMRLELDPVLQAPVRLAPEIDPNVHSCGSVPPHGAAELAHPEPGLYLVGMKSYGRAPTFLALTGYEQVRSVVAELTGDHEAAARVELTLAGHRRVRRVWSVRPARAGPATGGCCTPAAARPEFVSCPGLARRCGWPTSGHPDAGTGLPAGRVLATLCLTQVVSWGMVFYAFPVLSGVISREPAGRRQAWRRRSRRRWWSQRCWVSQSGAGWTGMGPER